MDTSWNENVTVNEGNVPIQQDIGWDAQTVPLHPLRTFLHAGLVIVSLILSACFNHGDKPILDVTASEVFADPAVVKLAQAAARGDRQAVLDLAQQGADVNARGDRDASVLLWAFLSQNLDGVKALLEAGADPALTLQHGETVLHYAAGGTDPAYLQALLDAGANPDIRNPLTGRTPIFDAIWYGREPQLRALIAAGADVNVQEFISNEPTQTLYWAGGTLSGKSPLHLAASINKDFMLLLLEAGADPLAKNAWGKTFQSSLNRLDESIIREDALARKRKVEAWLVEHGYELERERDSQ